MSVMCFPPLSVSPKSMKQHEDAFSILFSFRLSFKVTDFTQK